jgi:hypothetical protein
MGTITTQNIQNQLVRLKNDLKLANAMEIICEAFNKKDEFKFEFIMNGIDFGGELFPAAFYSCGSLNFNLNDVKRFERRFESSFGVKITNKEWLNVISSMKTVLKTIDDQNISIAFNIMNEIIKS